MVTCPKCKAENRPEAAFCSRCGTILFAQPASIRTDIQPAELAEMLAVTAKPAARPSEPASPAEPFAQPAEPGPAEPEPVVFRKLLVKPEGATFGERFQLQRLLTQGEHENLYAVTEYVDESAPRVQICSNPECHTIHCPVGPDVEKYCTQCGHALEGNNLSFFLHEADTDRYSYIKHVLELNLVHPNIHPPVAAFQQEENGNASYYMVTPFSADLPAQPAISDVLDWGIQLAGALDYLQSKGVILGDVVDLSGIGLVDKRAVWRDFTHVRILPMLTDREKINNLRLLGLAMYSLMTGSTSYTMDPYLPPALNELFEKALVGEGFTSGADLIQNIEQARAGGVERLVLDHRVGRRSHAGVVRQLNEDSLLSLELCTGHQGHVQPCGIFAIADGMGGHAAGDLASGLVINAIAQKSLGDLPLLLSPGFDSFSTWLQEAVQAANQAVYEARQRAGNDMGSTLVLCLLLGSQAYLTHQGDSRIYLINRQAVTQLTTDHSLVQHMVSIGQISQDEARFHPQRNVIYRSLGDKPYVEVECLTQPVFPHDRLLLCSDGLSNLIEDEALQKIVLEASSPQEACDRLVAAANAEGGEDNISVIVVEVFPV